MQKRPDLDWVQHVLHDVVTVLAENEMMQSAQMLAVVAAHIQHDLKREKPAPKPADAASANVVMFKSQKSRMN